MTRITLFSLIVVFAGLDPSVQGANKDIVLVAGAGKSGRAVVRELRDRGYSIRVLSRQPALDLGTGVAVFVGDVTRPSTLSTAVRGAKIVVSTVGATSPEGENGPQAVDFRGVVNLIDAAKSAGAKQFVLMSSTGAGNPDPKVFFNKNFGIVLKWKGLGEEHLRKSGLAYTIIRPGGLFDCEANQVGLNVTADREFGSSRICRSDVAQVIAATLSNTKALRKTIAVVSDEKMQIGAWRGAFGQIERDR